MNPLVERYTIGSTRAGYERLWAFSSHQELAGSTQDHWTRNGERKNTGTVVPSRENAQYELDVFPVTQDS